MQIIAGYISCFGLQQSQNVMCCNLWHCCDYWCPPDSSLSRCEFNNCICKQDRLKKTILQTDLHFKFVFGKRYQSNYSPGNSMEILLCYLPGTVANASQFSADIRLKSSHVNKQRAGADKLECRFSTLSVLKLTIKVGDGALFS